MGNHASCLPDGPLPAASAAPSPHNLNYSFGLPGGSYCLGIARGTVRRLLDAHGLGDMAELGVLAASELLGNAYLFTPRREASLSVRWRFGVLRMTVFDEHPAHPVDARAGCRTRRRQALAGLDAVVGACGGILGLAEAESPLGGNRVWVVLPRDAARIYAAL